LSTIETRSSAFCSCIAATFLAAGLAAAEASGTTAESGRTHLMILSGQSNMLGVDPGWIVEFAEQSLPGDTVLVAKVANYGKPIRLWVASWYELAVANGIDPAPYRERDEGVGAIVYQQLMEEIREALRGRPRPESVSFLWMQGESDTSEESASIYGLALQHLIGSLRRDLVRPDLIVVIGRLSDARAAEGTGWGTVRKVQVEIARMRRRAWVDTDDLNDKTKKGVEVDDLHLNRDGYRVLAQRMVLQASAIIRGEAPAADGRPE
jgi:hypothetical protein